MPVKNDRDYRNDLIEVRALDRNEENDKYIIEGYASTFDTYFMGYQGGYETYERIDPEAFNDTDMSDVIMQFDHSGRVLARISNGTLDVNVDVNGLHIRADLSSTEWTREVYEEVKAGLITKMSFAFTFDHSIDAYEYDEANNKLIRTIKRIIKLYDVSVVSLPANPNTSIGIDSRTLFNGEIERRKAERLDREKEEKAKKRLALRLKIGG